MSDSTALRALERNGRVLASDYTRQRRDLAAARRAAFVVAPLGPNQVWQLDFTEYEITQAGTWRISGCADYWAKAELGWHVSMSQNHPVARLLRQMGYRLQGNAKKREGAQHPTATPNFDTSKRSPPRPFAPVSR